MTWKSSGKIARKHLINSLVLFLHRYMDELPAYDNSSTPDLHQASLNICGATDFLVIRLSHFCRCAPAHMRSLGVAVSVGSPNLYPVSDERRLLT